MTDRKRWRSLLIALGLAFCLLVAGINLAHGGGQASSSQQRPLRLQLMWLPQTQFAGVYVAEELGLLDQKGFKVALQAGGPGIFPLQKLVRGETDVAFGWFSDALKLRQQGADIVNIAQLLKRPGTTLVCREDLGIHEPADVRGKRIGTWMLGDELDIGAWLKTHGMSLANVNLKLQRPNAQDLIDGRVECATAMSYNEYLTILGSGSLRSDLFTVRFGEQNSGFLEDGLYVRRADLNDPNKRRELAQLLRALAKGWRYAARYRDEAVTITARFMDNPDREHQREMLEEVLQLIDVGRGFGLLDPGQLRRSVAIVGAGSGSPAAVAAAAHNSWTHQIWRQAGHSGPQIGPLGPAAQHTFNELVNSRGFYVLDLIGTAAFGISGFLRALQRRYDLWGCFILTLLPAVGGGTLRDLLVGGLRSPPFIFKDGTYLGIVVAVVAVGSLLTQLQTTAGRQNAARLQRLLTLCDSVGLATFTIIGAKVAVEANLRWWWLPICAALTCAGGGLLLDVVTGREPRTFQGEPYEEIAITGALVLIAGLLIADRFETLRWPVLAAMVIAWAFTFMSRELVMRRNLRSWRPGHLEPSGR